MNDASRPKPGNQVFHPHRIARYRLRRVLGVPALFSIGYGDVGSSIYYGLGLVAVVALGATPIALGIAGLIYVCNALTYAEGSAMLTEGGGSSSYARLGFNELVGFISGWALMLSYVATMAISAYTIPPYLAYFWPVLKEPVASTLLSMGVIIFLMLVNIFGVKESSRLNITFIIGDIIMQVVLVILGAVLILGPNPHLLYQHMFGHDPVSGLSNWPSANGLIFGVALAALCFTGVESVSQHGEETRLPEKRMPQAYFLMIIVVLVLFAGISLVALTAMTPQALGDPVNGWARDPVAGIAQGVAQAITPADIIARFGASHDMGVIITWAVGWIHQLLPAAVAVLAASILLIATNAGLLGISRLTYNLSSHRQLPTVLSRVHSRFRTPYIAIGIFSSITLIMLIPGFFSDVFFSDLGALYVFGSLLCFGLAHASILALRVKMPEMPRPFKLGVNIRIGKRELPLTALLGLIATSAIFAVIMFNQATSRWTGLGWMALGLGIYFVYRRHRRMSPGGGEAINVAKPGPKDNEKA